MCPPLHNASQASHSTVPSSARSAGSAALPGAQRAGQGQGGALPQRHTACCRGEVGRGAQIHAAAGAQHPPEPNTANFCTSVVSSSPWLLSTKIVRQLTCGGAAGAAGAAGAGGGRGMIWFWGVCSVRQGAGQAVDQQQAGAQGGALCSREGCAMCARAAACVRQAGAAG